MSFNDFELVSLGEVADYVSDKVKIGDISIDNYVSTENLMPNFGGLALASGLPNTDKVNKFTKGDILISNIRPYFKKIWFADRNGGCSNDVLVLKANNKIDNVYLYYSLACDQFFDYVMTGAKGTKMPRGDKKHILNYVVNLPPLEEQKYIARTLATLDEKIEVNNQINKTLESMAQEIFKHWFIDFEFPNKNGDSYKSSGGEMVESELGMIPKGWEVGILGDLIDITSGKRPKSRSDEKDERYIFPLIGASSAMGYTENYNFDEAILVIGRVGTHGVVQRYDMKIWASDNTLVIKSECYEYVNQILSLIDYKALNRGSTQPLITQADIKNHRIIIPSQDVLVKYEVLVGSIFKLHLSNCNENEKLSSIRDTLLPKLMSGEMTVHLYGDDEVS